MIVDILGFGGGKRDMSYSHPPPPHPPCPLFEAKAVIQISYFLSLHNFWIRYLGGGGGERADLGKRKNLAFILLSYYKDKCELVDKI